MALQKIRVQRNLHAKMRWLAFEIDDLILLGLLWVATELASNFVHRMLFGLPAEAILPWMAVLLTYAGIRLFKYNRPPAYLLDLLVYYRLPRIWCASEPDPVPAKPYLSDSKK
ncbi:MAG: hypothetical protein ACRD4Q_15935 [Candidatus Acidiferrales bacterium]